MKDIVISKPGHTSFSFLPKVSTKPEYVKSTIYARISGPGDLHKGDAELLHSNYNGLSVQRRWVFQTEPYAWHNPRFGKYKIHEVDVAANFNCNGSTDGWFSNRSYADTNYGKTTFSIRGASRATLQAKRVSKKTVKFSVAAKRLALNGNAGSAPSTYVGYNAKKVKLQKKVGKKWKTVKTFNIKKKGKASFSVKAKKKASYRVVIPQTSTYAGKTSKTVRR